MMFLRFPRQLRPSPIRRPLMRRAFLFALIPAVLLAGRIAKSETVPVPTNGGDTWEMTISPAVEKVRAAEIQVALSDKPTLVAQQDDVAPYAPAESLEAPEPRVAVALMDEPVVSADASAAEMAIEPQPAASEQVSEYKRIYDALPFSRAEYLANPSYRHDTTMELLTGEQRQIVVHRNYTPKLHGPRKLHPLFLYNRYGGGTGFDGPYGGYGGGYGFGLGFRYIPQYAPSFRYFLPIEHGY